MMILFSKVIVFTIVDCTFLIPCLAVHSYGHHNQIDRDELRFTICDWLAKMCGNNAFILLLLVGLFLFFTLLFKYTIECSPVESMKRKSTNIHGIVIDLIWSETTHGNLQVDFISLTNIIEEPSIVIKCTEMEWNGISYTLNCNWKYFLSIERLILWNNWTRNNSKAFRAMICKMRMRMKMQPKHYLLDI